MLKRRLLALGLTAMGAIKTPRLLSKLTVGVIFMLHKVAPASASTAGFCPNRHLTVTPGFLRKTIDLVRQHEVEIVSMDDAAARLREQRPGRFAVFSFDDGYRNNLIHGLPVFQAAEAPFAVYVPSAWPDGGGNIWWQVLEDVVASTEQIELEALNLPRKIGARTTREKYRLFYKLREYFMANNQQTLEKIIRDLAERYKIDIRLICEREIMNRAEIAQLSRSRLVTIGAHSRTHAQLSQLDTASLAYELVSSREAIEEMTGRSCIHCSYPYGGGDNVGPREFEAAAAAGFKTGLTTRRDLVIESDKNHLMALPRIPLDGDMQNIRVIRAQLSGVPMALRRGLEHLKNISKPSF